MPDPAESVGLVLDTSVWINLLATGAMEAILGALAVPCYAPEQVVAEVRRHPATGTAFPMESQGRQPGGLRRDLEAAGDDRVGVRAINHMCYAYLGFRY
jgi:hypothetical protein